MYSNQDRFSSDHVFFQWNFLYGIIIPNMVSESVFVLEEFLLKNCS